MNINASLFIQWIPFAVLVFVTMRYIWPPITQALDERAAKIRDGLSAADKAKAELVNVNKRVEEQLAQTRDESAKRLADAERLAASIIEDAKRKATEEANKIVSSAQSEAVQELVKARNALRDEVAQLAIKGAEQILRKEINPVVHAELLAQLKAEL